MAIQFSGSITDQIDEYTQLYKRGMDELASYLEDI